MKFLNNLPFGLLLGFDVIGPVVVLLLVKRRSGSWRRAALACLLIATVGAFLVNGTMSWLITGLRELIWGSTHSTALMTAFPVGGIYGVLFALTLLPFTLALVGLWRYLHPRSFASAIAQRASAAPHGEGANG